MQKYLYTFILNILFLSFHSAAADQFPLRAEFPKVTPIELSDLQKKYDEVIIVDVRSKFEYDIVHIQKAIHIPMNNKSLFIEKLLATRGKDDPKPIVLYCNGIKCKKSYEAATYALDAGFKNVYCFDFGVINWLKANPAKSYLLGKMPADPKKVISDQQFQAHLVDFATFKKAADDDKNNVMFDVRDATQQTKKLELPHVKNIQLDNILGLLEKGTFKDKHLYVMDAVGKQVEWLQYYLEEYGYKNYHFLKGGVDAN